MLDRSGIMKLINDLKLPDNEYWVSAGAGLVLHGVKAFTRDIDIGCTSNVVEILLHQGCSLSLASDGTRKIKLGEFVEFFENWFADDVETIDGICVASLLSIKKQKVVLGREKDLQDIALIDVFISSNTT